MKIRFLSCAQHPWGAEHSLALLATEFVAEGHSVELYCMAREVASFWQDRVRGDVSVVTHGHGRVSSSIAMARALRQAPPADSTVIWSLDLTAVSWLARGSSSSFFLDLHDLPRSLATRGALKVLQAQYSKVICISDYIARRSSVNQARRATVPRPIEETAATTIPSTRNGLMNVGVVGRIDKIKNLELAVDACKLVSSGVHLHFRGAPMVSDREYVQSLLEYGRRNLGTQFTFGGLFEAKDVYEGLDLVVVTNQEEPSGRTVGEAQANGLPVVVPDEGGAQEWVEAGVTGLVYQSGDAKSLANSISTLLRQPALAGELAEAGRRAVEAQRAPAKIARMYSDVLRNG